MQAKINIKVNLLITVTGSWEDECYLSQVKKQALDGAKVSLSRLLHNQKDFTQIGTEIMHTTLLEDPK